MIRYLINGLRNRIITINFISLETHIIIEIVKKIDILIMKMNVRNVFITKES